MSFQTPESIEVQDFKFVTHSKIKVFQNCNSQPLQQPNLITSASRFGLIFAANNDQIKAIQLSSILQSSINDKTVPLRTQQLTGYISYLSLNCDHTILAISLNVNGIWTVQFYDVTSFYKQTITLVNEVRLTNAPKQIVWNPCIANILAASLEDGSLWTCELNGNALNLNNTENRVQAVSLSWSPKGKQIVTGTLLGTLCQFKPDLKLVKTIVVPELKGAIISVQWLSNYQFATVFHDKSDPRNVPSVIIVNAPKAGPVFCFNYEEVCYNSREQEHKHVSFIHQPNWSILLILSLNSTEVGILGGTTVQDLCNWQQWFLMDDGRAEIPLVGKDESYPCGFAFDTGVTTQVTTADSKTLQPMPMLHLLTDRGFLISFDILNEHNDSSSICCPPEPIRDGSGLSLFILETEKPDEHSKVNVNVIEPAVIPTTTQNIPSAVPQGSGDFSFLANKTAVTSTPEKSLDIGSVNRVHKTDSNIFGKTLPTNIENKSSVTLQQIGATTSATTNLFATNNLAFSYQPALNSTNLPNVMPEPVSSIAFIPAPSTEIKPSAQIMQPIPVTTIQPSTISTGKDLQLAEESFNTTQEVEENNEAILNLIQTETNQFYKDFTDVMARSSRIDIQCGTEKESNLLYSGISELKGFIDEANESTQNQHFEVQALRQTLMEAFSWISEAKCKYSSGCLDGSDVTSVEHIQNSADLDLLSKHQLSAITKLLYYVESQMMQLNKQIDEQWSDFQDKCKVRAKGRMHIPSMESFYQTLLKQGDILSRQKELVDEVLMKIKKKSPHNTHSFSKTGNIMELSNLLSNMKVSSQDLSEIHKDRVIALKSQFMKNKQEALLKVLSNRSSIEVIPVKVNFNDCKSSIVLDRIKKIKDKKLKPSIQVSKTTDFKSQLNDYMEKQMLLNQQHNNSINNVSRNLSTMFDASSTTCDTIFKNETPITKVVQQKPQITIISKPENVGLVPLTFGKPKPTTAPLQVLNPAIKIAAKPTDIENIASINPTIQSSPFSSIKPNFSFISGVVSDTKTVPATSSSAFSVITPGFNKQNQLSFGARPTSESKNETGLPAISFGMSTNTGFNFTSPTTQTDTSTKPVSIETNSSINLKDKPFGQSAKNDTLQIAGLNNSTLNFDASNNKVSPTSSNVLSSTISISNSIVSSNTETLLSSTATSSTPPVIKQIPKSANAEISTEKSEVMKDSITITPIISNSKIPMSSSFNFASSAIITEPAKQVDSSSKPIGASLFANNLKIGEDVKSFAKKDPTTTTSSQSTFTFSLGSESFDDLKVSSSGIDSTTKQSEISFDPKICSPTSFGKDESKANLTNTNIFGMNPATSSSSIPTTTGISTSPATSLTFGFSTNSMFGGSTFGKNPQTSIFGGSSSTGNVASTTPSTTNIFQQENKNETKPPTTNIFGNQASVFSSTGFGANNVQNKPLEMSKSTFDMSTTGSTSNVFGSPSKTETTNTFPASPLKPATAMFGQQAVFGSSNLSGGSIFGGAATQSNPAFGSPQTNTGSTFGSPSTGFSGGSVFGGGAFSGGNSSVAQGGFGSPLAMGKSTPGGFGSPPAFGAPAATFGSASAFGGSASFGSPNNVFASAAQPTAFTSPTQQSNTFENLASSNVISFGNLAQGSGVQQQPKPAAFSGSSSFSSWR